MSAPQFRRWASFYALEPLAEKRGDWQAAAICSAIWNSSLMRVRSDKRFRVKDFLLEFQNAVKDLKKEKGQTWQQMQAIAKMWVTVGNAEEKRLGKRRR